MQQNGSVSAQDLEDQEMKAQQKDISKDREKLKEMELRTLRAEELRRIQLRQTIIQLALTGAGALLTFSIQYKLSYILLFFPFLMLWIALLWRQNLEILVTLRAYIADYIEAGESFQWERRLQRQIHPIWNYDTAFTLLFFCSDLIALGVGIAQSSPPIILILLSSTCTLLTALTLFWRRPSITEYVDIPRVAQRDVAKP